tara:strand:+ start:5060 stop:5548 length:489 start_codon:yes stop_codon:yes gene_type:complete
MKGECYSTGKKNEGDSWSVMNARGFVRPTPKQRKSLVAAYSSVGKTLKMKGFDLIRESDAKTIDDPQKLLEAIDNIELFELKTAGKERKAEVGGDWLGLGFTLTNSERHNAETLGNNFKFIFLNLKNNNLHECSLEDFFSSEISNIYPTWSIFIKKGLTNDS